MHSPLMLGLHQKQCRAEQHTHLVITHGAKLRCAGGFSNARLFTSSSSSHQFVHICREVNKTAAKQYGTAEYVVSCILVMSACDWWCTMHDMQYGG